MLEELLSKFIRFKRGGLLPRRFQFGGQADYYELPTMTISNSMIFDPRVYVGRKGGSSSNEANLKAMWTKAKPFYDELTRRGINPYIAVGILGNMALESSFDPNANYKGHYGYLLNETTARDWINASYGGYGHLHQMNFLVDGLTGKLKGDPKHRWAKEFNKRFSGFLNATRNSKDINYITHAWEQHYERSGGLANSKRLMYARYFAKQLGLIK